jgi:hypothetical protein
MLLAINQIKGFIFIFWGLFVVVGEYFFLFNLAEEIAREICKSIVRLIFVRRMVRDLFMVGSL